MSRRRKRRIESPHELIEPVDTFARRPLGYPGHPVVGRVHASSHSDIESAARKLIDGDHLLGENHRLSVDEIRHQHREPQTFGHDGPGCQRGPAVETWTRGVAGVPQMIGGRIRSKPASAVRRASDIASSPAGGE